MTQVAVNLVPAVGVCEVLVHRRVVHGDLSGLLVISVNLSSRVHHVSLERIDKREVLSARSQAVQLVSVLLVVEHVPVSLGQNGESCIQVVKHLVHHVRSPNLVVERWQHGVLVNIHN